jgi:glycosyltransferase involved in cell wall biosynthesis
MDLSVVIPVYNNEDKLIDLGKSLVEILYTMPLSFEIIMVDDGSTDSSAKRMMHLTHNDNCIKGICLNKNSGQHAAVMIGLRHSAGNYILLMDDDMEYAAPCLPEFWQKTIEGCDVVSGKRENRKYIYKIRHYLTRNLNLIINLISSKKFMDATSSFKLFKKGLIVEILEKGVTSLLVPELLMMKGTNIIELPLPCESREKHPNLRSRYNVKKLLTHGLLFCGSIFYRVFGYQALCLLSRMQSPLQPDKYSKIGFIDDSFTSKDLG